MPQGHRAHRDRLVTSFSKDQLAVAEGVLRGPSCLLSTPAGLKALAADAGAPFVDISADPRAHALSVGAYRGGVTAIGRVQRVVLLLVLIVGVLGMHVLMTAGPGHGHCVVPDAMSTSAVSTDPTPVGDSMITGAPWTHSAGMIDAPATDTECGNGSAPMPRGSHDLLHLCMAILVAGILVLAGLAAMLLVFSSSARSVAESVSGVHPHPRRPPPQHGVRLATLCVMRN